ncbi:MAG: SDR family NAD(P)-dependent oxidoreductase [Alphaproteobacteria bacterium]|nr:SDR family NAD(P)-dependent oxidoreductase [Alphaproteobacteria bacterium]
MTNWNDAGRTAVITGGASGIGLATAVRLLGRGMNVVVADRDQAALDVAQATLQAAGADRVLARVCDVADDAQVIALRDAVLDRFGGVHFLMNNAGSGMAPGLPWENLEAWKTLSEINLWGVIRGCQAFIPAMIDAGARGVIVNTGSKQGITKPPGNCAYNLSKAGVLAYTECLAHALRQIPDGALSAHLLVPGYTFTGMTGARAATKPAGAWTPDQVAGFMFDALEKGDFYILCPDNDVTRAMDEKRIQWAADDLIQNRPALSRWHPDFADAFAKYMDS